MRLVTTSASMLALVWAWVALAGMAALPAHGEEAAPITAPSTVAPVAPPPASGAATGAGAPDDPQAKLRKLQGDIGASESRRRTLANEIATFQTDHARFEAELIATTGRVSDDEGKIASAQARLDGLTVSEAATSGSLDKRRALVADVLAALQRMGRRPPPALLVEPDDVLKAIRTSMLLGSVVPGMRSEIDSLIADLADLSRTRTAIATERRALDADLASIAVERSRLGALIDARQAAIGQATSDLDRERDMAKQMAEKAGSLRDLITGMERDNAAAAKAAEAAHQSDLKLAALAPNGAAIDPTPFKNPARLAPAVAFSATKGLLPLPVGGSVLKRFGDDDGVGGSEKGTLVETNAGSMVAAPADGWIAYAGPYRSFGQLLILNAGGGYYIVLAGMDRINVSLGQFVLAGEPVAVMGDGSTKTAAAIALGAVRPVLYVEFRKDGATIDPGPWWAKPELQKVRG